MPNSDNLKRMQQLSLGRRQFLSMASAASTGLLASGCVTGGFMKSLAPTTAGPVSTAPTAELPEKKIAFYNKVTKEHLETVFQVGDKFVPEAVFQISNLLRDHHSGETHKIDMRLINWMHQLQQELGTETVIQVLSGYRSPVTNASLRKKSRRVARNSMHMQGKALDFRFEGIPVKKVRSLAVDIAEHQGFGGIGYYSRQGFMHLDTGPKREWRS